MPKIGIHFAESAVADLEALRAWYAEQGVPDVGDRLVDELLTRIEALSHHPQIGRMVPEFERPRLREIVHPPFRIIYREDPKRVRIVRIWRSERLLALPDDEGSKPAR